MPMTELQTRDEQTIGAYLAEPDSRPKGGIVVIQEIFGVNEHIRDICDRLVAEGYCAIAPAIFDRQEPGFESGYSPEEVERAKGFIGGLDFAACLVDVEAARDRIAHAGKVGVLGFCLGGTLAFLSAARLGGLSAASCLYGGMIEKFADEVPDCPVQFHFGEEDASIPPENYNSVHQKRPEAEFYVYEGAGHGFNCDRRASYEPESAKLAWARAMSFFGKHVA